MTLSVVFMAIYLIPEKNQQYYPRLLYLFIYEKRCGHVNLAPGNTADRLFRFVYIVLARGDGTGAD